MATRRQILGAATAAAFLGACKPAEPTSKAAGDRLLIDHHDGLGIFDGGTGKWLAEPKTGTVNGSSLATLDGEMLRLRDTATAQVSGECKLTGVWTPRATNGDQVALLAGRHASADIYRPEPRTQTSLLIIREGKERKRFDLPGNFEPEAFSVNGDRLYILDYLPPKAPSVYRVRVLDLVTGEIQPLLTKTKTLIPDGAEEVMRGQGRHAVFDKNRGILFTLYTHQGDHQHTGELLGVRPGAPNVHSFIHALHLDQGWAFCIDLPAPFGVSGAQGHTIALSADASELYAISAEHGILAVINPNPDELNVLHTRSFKPAKGEAYAVALAPGQLLIGAGRQLTLMRESDHEEWTLDFDLRGLASAGKLWAGRDGSVTALDLQARRILETVAVNGLTSLRQAIARR